MARPFKVDGVEIPTPTTYKVGIADLSSDATGRTLDGVMHKDVVAVKHTYDCTWYALSWAEAAHLLNLVNGKESLSFTHPDPLVPDVYQTGVFYVGDRSISAKDLTSDKNAWHDLTLSFIQI